MPGFHIELHTKKLGAIVDPIRDDLRLSSMAAVLLLCFLLRSGEFLTYEEAEAIFCDSPVPVADLLAELVACGYASLEMRPGDEAPSWLIRFEPQGGAA